MRVRGALSCCTAEHTQGAIGSQASKSNQPSFFMLTARHLLNLQAWHWFLLMTSTTHLPLSLHK